MRRRERVVLGIGIGEGSVRAILWQHGAVEWQREWPVDADTDLGSTLSEALLSAPSDRRRKHAVAIAIGPTRAQLKRLRNLPSVRDHRALDAIVQQSAGRYFRQNGIPMRTTGVAIDAPGEGWAGAIEAPLVEMAMDICWAAGHRDVVVVPTAAVLGAADTDGSLLWQDGDVMLMVRRESNALVDCRCIPVSASASLPASDKARVDAESMPSDFADAVGAAQSAFTSPLALRVDPRRQPATQGRVIGAGILCTASLALLLSAPAIRAAREEQASIRTLAKVSTAATAASITEGELAERSRMLGELARFQRGSSSTLMLLASLTRHIKAPASVMSLTLDSDGGTMTAVTPSASSLVAALRQVPEIAAPTIAGAVTPEAQQPPMMGPPLVAPGASLAPSAPPPPSLQRVTIRLHWEGERASRRMMVGGR